MSRLRIGAEVRVNSFLIEMPLIAMFETQRDFLEVGSVRGVLRGFRTSCFTTWIRLSPGGFHFLSSLRMLERKQESAGR
jgi:hypothetical protein